MMRRAVGTMVVTAAAFAACPEPAYAYLDPGTASMLLQGLIGAVAGALVAIRVYWAKIRGFFTRSDRAQPTSPTDEQR